MIGHDGLSGLAVILGGSESPFGVSVQKAGTAYRIASDELQAASAASRTLHAFMLQYAQVFLTQTAETARANARFTVEQRVARWLLMAHDRTDADDIEVTHGFLARMLGVRRPGVTIATHVLEGDHLISARRGHIRVIDRPGLEALAGTSYGLPEAEHQRLIARPSRTSSDMQRRLGEIREDALAISHDPGHFAPVSVKLVDHEWPSRNRSGRDTKER
jgi:hypothetical protein